MRRLGWVIPLTVEAEMADRDLGDVGVIFGEQDDPPMATRRQESGQ